MHFILCALILPLLYPIWLLVKYCLRHKYPVTVDCWFCGEKTAVPYDNKNCWDCPSCEQYNGFNEDGGFNKPIPAQYDDRLNHPIRCQDDEFIGGDNVFCERCNQKQLLKIQQLAKFVPYNEKNFDQEVEAFKQRIEKVYRLCPSCEKHVEQTLQSQDEAISMRLSHLDAYRSFLENSYEEAPFLHASYTDRRIDKPLAASFVLHTISLLCSVLVGLKEVSLHGEHAWQKHLLFLHPFLLWLDRNMDFLVVIGLMAGVTAKLCLGKYRLHIIDAFSCPVWLLVLLSQTGFLTIYKTGSVYHICSLVLNFISTSICLGLDRKRRDQSNLSMAKMPMDTASEADSFSSVSTYSAAKKEGQRSRSEEERSEDGSSVHVTSTTDPDQTGFSQMKHNVASSDLDTKRLPNAPYIAKRDTSGGEGNSAAQQDNIADTTTVLDAFSLGEPSMGRNTSGLFSSDLFGSLPSNLNNQSVSQNLHSRKLGQGRPLLSPPTFTHESSVASHRSSPVSRHGLFSVPARDKLPSFTDTPSSTRRPSAFTPTPTKFFSSQRHSFTPERPASPVVTSFGESPFSNVPLLSDSHSQFSTPSIHTSFSVARDNSSVAKGSSAARHHQSVARKRLAIAENSDSEDDSFSAITSVSKRFSPSRHGKLEQTPDKKVLWYQHPGFLGFLFGGSVVANVIFIAQSWLHNAS